MDASGSVSKREKGPDGVSVYLQNGRQCHGKMLHKLFVPGIRQCRAFGSVIPGQMARFSYPHLVSDRSDNKGDSCIRGGGVEERDDQGCQANHLA